MANVACKIFQHSDQHGKATILFYHSSCKTWIQFSLNSRVLEYYSLDPVSLRIMDLVEKQLSG